MYEEMLDAAPNLCWLTKKVLCSKNIENPRKHSPATRRPRVSAAELPSGRRREETAPLRARQRGHLARRAPHGPAAHGGAECVAPRPDHLGRHRPRPPP